MMPRREQIFIETEDGVEEVGEMYPEVNWDDVVSGDFDDEEETITGLIPEPGEAEWWARMANPES